VSFDLFLKTKAKGSAEAKIAAVALPETSFRKIGSGNWKN